MQVLQQAVDAIKGLDDTRLADHIRNATFKTVVGDVRFGDRGEWAQPRILQVQFQNIRGNDIEQFRDPRTQVILDPPGYAVRRSDLSLCGRAEVASMGRAA